jgi:hypothetical protein
LARLRDVITAGIYCVRDLVVGAPILAVRDAELLSHPAVRGGASWTALRVLLLTVPLILVFSILLSRADPVFASVFSVPAIDAELVMSHVVIAGAFAWWSAGWLRGALLGVSRRPALPDRLPLQLGLPEITTSLGSVIALFAVFVALQVRWLFGGADVVLATTGLTVAEYARRGFFELVAVATLVLPLILGTRALIEDERIRRRHRQLSLVLLALMGAIMASALLRMQLYVSHYGLTVDRLYATVMMIWLGVVAVAMARTVLGGWPRPFASITVLSAFGTLIGLNVVNPDLLVARVNLGRTSASQGVDYEYLARLSGDAIPAVAQALGDAPASASSCAAARHLRERWLQNEPVDWNLGVRRGQRAVSTTVVPALEQRLCAGQPATLPPVSTPPAAMPPSP